MALPKIGSLVRVTKKNRLGINLTVGKTYDVNEHATDGINFCVIDDVGNRNYGFQASLDAPGSWYDFEVVDTPVEQPTITDAVGQTVAEGDYIAIATTYFTSAVMLVGQVTTVGTSDTVCIRDPRGRLTLVGDVSKRCIKLTNYVPK